MKKSQIRSRNNFNPMNSFYKLSIVLFSACFFMACQRNTDTASGPDPLLSHIDSTVKPGEDFFLYANGRWFKEHPIPASEQQNGLWQMIQDTINAQVLNICESSAAMANPEKGSNKQKIGDFYYSGMDSLSINAAGMQAIKDEMARIDLIQNDDDILVMAGAMHSLGASPLFGFGVGQDDKISSKNAIFFGQGGLSLPDRNYYFDADARTVMVRGKFVQHLQNMFVLMGYDATKAAAAATRLMKLETAIAGSHRKREDTRDPQKNYNKMDYKSFCALTPSIRWDVWMNQVGLIKVDTVIIGQPEALTALNGFLKSFPVDDWKDYLRYHLLRSSARFMDDKTYSEYFSFYTTVLRGVKEQKPRWKRVVEMTNNHLGELIGQVYVAEYLPKGTKEKLMEIGESIRTVYAERIQNLDWMSETTKKKAIEKLKSIVMKVGYPDTWKDMSTVSVDRKSYLQNAFSVARWRFNYMIAKYGQPVNRKEWSMYPQTYNAYYNPSNNEIVVPGCNIIVPGFERKMADDAILYSIIGGSTFGHEITHGFDDQGCQYDANGNLNNWWTSEDSTRFFTKTQGIVKQFDNYIAVDSLHINGSLTQGENIADLGGIIMGYEAFKKTAQYKNKEMIAGLNPDQRFFLGYALAWMINSRPEAIADQVKSNEHAPAKFRVLGPLSNMPEFYATFGIKEGEAMWRKEEDRVKIW